MHKAFRASAESGKASRMIDVEAARAVTPGCADLAHFNNAGASLVSAPVLDAVIDHLRLEASIGGYEAEALRQPEIDAVYTSGATVLGCSADELAFTDSSTRAWTLAFGSLTFAPGDRVLTGTSEYISNAFGLLQARERFGIEIVVVPDDDHGQVNVSKLDAAIDDRTRLVALTHVATGGGMVNPAEQVGAITSRTGVPFLLDACQSVGQLDVDVAKLRCDMMSFTGRKYLRAPRGTAMLYVRSGFLPELRSPIGLDGNGATWNSPLSYTPVPTARRFEGFESSIAGKLGLGAAFDHLLGWGIDDVADRTTMLAELLRARLESVPGAAVHDKGLRRCGIVTFTLAGQQPDAIKRYLQEHRVNVSVSDAGSSQFDYPNRGLMSVVRASVHYYNTEEEIDRLVDLLAKLVSM